jgi:hypothetical protein
MSLRFLMWLTRNKVSTARRLSRDVRTTPLWPVALPALPAAVPLEPGELRDSPHDQCSTLEPVTWHWDGMGGIHCPSRPGALRIDDSPQLSDVGFRSLLTLPVQIASRMETSVCRSCVECRQFAFAVREVRLFWYL